MRRQPLAQSRSLVPGERDDHPGIGAELADAERDRLRQRLSQRFTAVADRRGEDEDGIYAPHLGVDRDRVGARGSGIEERAPAAERAGEADRARERMPDHCQPHVVGPAVQQREDAGGHVTGRDGAFDGGSDERRRCRLRRMRLVHDGTASAERRRRVVARGAEGERKVARAEHRHGAERNEHAPEVGARRGRARWISAIDAHLEPGPILDRVGDQAQLVHGSRAFSLQSGDGEPGLGVRRGGQHIGSGIDLAGDGAKEVGARLPRVRSIVVERPLGAFERVRYVVGGGFGERRLECLAGGGIDRVEGRHGREWCAA